MKMNKNNTEENIEIIDPSLEEPQATEEAPKENKKKAEQVSIDSDELEQLNEELASWKSKYFLALAETENSRKRQQKERKEMTRYALENVITDILKPLDDLKMALKFTSNASEDVQNWALGFNMIAQQFADVLAANDIKEFSALGEHFDPYLHEAVEAIEDTSQPAGKIIEELCCGYKAGDRIIRVARVKVIKHPALPIEEIDTPPEGEEES